MPSSTDTALRPLAKIVILLAIIALPIFWKYGTIDPCGILRSQVRQEAMQERGFVGAVVGVIPDGLIDALVSAQYGELTPQRCVGILFGRGSRADTFATPPAQPTQPTVKDLGLAPELTPSSIQPQPSRQTVPEKILYANPLWNAALVDLFGRDADALYEKTGQRKHDVWFAYPYQDGAARSFYAVFTKTLVANSTDGSPSECHACGMLISVATYEHGGNGWSLQSAQANVGSFGEWGKVPIVNTPEKMQFDASNFMLLVDFENYHMETMTRGKAFLNRGANGWKFIGGVITHQDSASTVWPQLRYTYDSTLSLVPRPGASYPDIQVARVGTEYDLSLREAVPARTVLYRFDGEKYVELNR